MADHRYHPMLRNDRTKPLQHTHKHILVNGTKAPPGAEPPPILLPILGTGIFRLWSAAACEEFSLICPSCLPSDPPLRAGDALPAGDRREVDLVHRVGAVGAALAGGWRRRTAVVAGARRRVAVVPAHLALLCVKMENGQKHQKGFGKLEGGAPKYWGATPQAENVFCIVLLPAACAPSLLSSAQHSS